MGVRRQGRRPRRSLGYRIVITLLRPAMALLFRVRVQGRLPTEGPLVVAANHVSYLDPVVLAVLLHRAGHDARFLTVAEVFRRPVVGAVLHAGRFIPVTAGRWQRAVAARTAAEGLRAGHTVVIYPEGTIPSAGRPLEAQPGVAWLARTTGAPVVPIATAGMHRLPRRGAWLRRRRAAVVVGPVLHPGLVAMTDPPSSDRLDGRAEERRSDRFSAGEVLSLVRALVPAAEALAAHPIRRRARTAHHVEGR